MICSGQLRFCEKGAYGRVGEFNALATSIVVDQTVQGMHNGLWFDKTVILLELIRER